MKQSMVTTETTLEFDGVELYQLLVQYAGVEPGSSVRVTVRQLGVAGPISFELTGQTSVDVLVRSSQKRA